MLVDGPVDEDETLRILLAFNTSVYLGTGDDTPDTLPQFSTLALVAGAEGGGTGGGVR